MDHTEDHQRCTRRCVAPEQALRGRAAAGAQRRCRTVATWEGPSSSRVRSSGTSSRASSRRGGVWVAWRTPQLDPLVDARRSDGALACRSPSATPLRVSGHPPRRQRPGSVKHGGEPAWTAARSPSRRPGSTRTEPGTSSGTSTGSSPGRSTGSTCANSPGSGAVRARDFPRARVSRSRRLPRMGSTARGSDQVAASVLAPRPEWSRRARQRASGPRLAERRRPPLVDEGHGSPRRCQRSGDARTDARRPRSGRSARGLPRPCL